MLSGASLAHLSQDPVTLCFYVVLWTMFVGVPICERFVATYLQASIQQGLLRTLFRTYSTYVPPSYSGHLLGWYGLFVLGHTLWMLFEPTYPYVFFHQSPTRRRFKRRKLPYWLVRRCRQRVGNRPPRDPGRINHDPRVHQDVPTRYDEDTAALYEAWTSMSPIEAYVLPQLQPTSATSLTSCLGPGGQLLSLDQLNGTNMYQTVAQRALYLGQRYSKSSCNVHETPLVFDTGASTGLTPFRADFLTYSPVNF